VPFAYVGSALVESNRISNPGEYRQSAVVSSSPFHVSRERNVNRGTLFFMQFSARGSTSITAFVSFVSDIGVMLAGRCGCKAPASGACAAGGVALAQPAPATDDASAANVKMYFNSL